MDVQQLTTMEQARAALDKARADRQELVIRMRTERVPHSEYTRLSDLELAILGRMMELESE